MLSQALYGLNMAVFKITKRYWWRKQALKIAKKHPWRELKIALESSSYDEWKVKTRLWAKQIKKNMK